MFEPVPAGLDSAAGDDTAMSALRLSAVALADGTDWSRLDDHAVITQLAAAHAQGRLLAHAPPPPTALYRLARVKAPAAAPASAPAPAPSPRAAPASAAARPEPAVPALDAVAMAAALRSASDSGAPFVEECLAEDAA